MNRSRQKSFSLSTPSPVRTRSIFVLCMQERSGKVSIWAKTVGSSLILVASPDRLGWWGGRRRWGPETWLLPLFCVALDTRVPSTPCPKPWWSPAWACPSGMSIQIAQKACYSHRCASAIWCFCRVRRRWRWLTRNTVSEFMHVSYSFCPDRGWCETGKNLYLFIK